MYGKTSQKNNNSKINQIIVHNKVDNNNYNNENGYENMDEKDKRDEKEKKFIVPYHLKKIVTMCASESLKDLILLFQYFELTVVLKGGVLWRVGDTSVSAILLCKGGLISHSLRERELDDNKDNNEFLLINDNITYDNDKNSRISSKNNNNNINSQNIGSDNGNKNVSGIDRHIIKINDTEIEKGGGSSEGGREREEDEEHGEDFEEIYIGHLIGMKGVCVFVDVCVCMCEWMCIGVSMYVSVCVYVCMFVCMYVCIHHTLPSTLFSRMINTNISLNRYSRRIRINKQIEETKHFKRKRRFRDISLNKSKILGNVRKRSVAGLIVV